MSGVVSWLMYPCQFGQRNCNRAKQDICSLLGITTLLGITWGLIFFSFGQLTTAALYPFSILNSLQGLLNLPWLCIQYITVLSTSLCTGILMTPLIKLLLLKNSSLEISHPIYHYFIFQNPFIYVQ